MAQHSIAQQIWAFQRCPRWARTPRPLQTRHATHQVAALQRCNVHSDGCGIPGIPGIPGGIPGIPHGGGGAHGAWPPPHMPKASEAWLVVSWNLEIVTSWDYQRTYHLQCLCTVIIHVYKITFVYIYICDSVVILSSWVWKPLYNYVERDLKSIETQVTSFIYF